MTSSRLGETRPSVESRDDVQSTRAFLIEEFRVNRSHADHINDHRLEFLKFFVGVVISAVGLTEFLLLQIEASADRDVFLQPLLLSAIAFGILTVLILSNYWVGRDFMRLKNRVIVEELAKQRPNSERYHSVSKAHVKKLPSPTSMFAFVLGLVVIANDILLFLLLAVRGTPWPLAWISTATILQAIVVLSYRRLIHGRVRAPHD